MSLSPLELPKLVTCHILKLPPELTRKIFLSLDFNSLKAVRQVCKTWQLFSEERSLWKKFIDIDLNALNKWWVDGGYARAGIEKIQLWKNLSSKVENEGTIGDILYLVNFV